MSFLDNIANIAFSSNHNFDKILGTYTGSFSVAAADFPPFQGKIGTSSTAQGFGAGVLPIMVWSNNQVDWLEAGARDYNAGGSLDTTFTATAYTTSSTFVIVGHNFTGSTAICYWKLVLISDE